MVNIRELLAKAKAALEKAEIPDAEFEVQQLFKLATGKDSLLFTHADAISDADGSRLLSLCEKRAEHYPLQYLCGEWDFMNITLKIGEGVLIPRADTECVCEAAIEKCRLFPHARVVDLCSGSGAIALGIKAILPNVTATAVELSDDAIYYLKENAKDNIQVVKADVLTWQRNIEDNSIDVLTANPPYIAQSEMGTLAKELSFEPRMALCDEGDGLLFYRHIISAYKPKLAKGGYIVLEIGAAQGEGVAALLRQSGYEDIELRQDYSGNDRVLLCRKA
ncbi:MAG: peptide chain release factor N(5)-glutamine methyltransferase [Oscillospiraceae bacterium]